MKEYAKSRDERTSVAARGVLLRIGELHDPAAAQAAAAGQQAVGGGGETKDASSSSSATRYSVFLSHKVRRRSAYFYASQILSSFLAAANARTSFLIA